MSTQLALPLGLRDDATFENFFPGENNHCILIIDTHGYVSDSDTEDSDEIIHTNDTPR